MSGFQVVEAPLDDRARGARLFAGELLVFRGLQPLAALLSVADALIRDAFAPHEPETAQSVLARAAFLARAGTARRAFASSEAIAGLCRDTLAAAGVEPARTWWDRLRLRIQPGGLAHQGGRIVELPPHRDSWGSNVMAQANWWAPVYPLTAERTMMLWPGLFGRRVTNDSATWDLEELQRRLSGSGRGSYPLLPSAAAWPDETGLPVLIAPGELLCFSAAHLHGSVPNRTGRTRFSFELRTVSGDDWLAGRGATNLDGDAPRTPLDWFRHMLDGGPLPART